MTDRGKLEQLTDVVIVGAGLAGLACAKILDASGVNYIVLEASDDIGGRTRSDVVDDLILDRGFHVFLPGYPEARRLLNLKDLELEPFHRGLYVDAPSGAIELIEDPRQSLSALGALRTLLSTTELLALSRAAVSLGRKGRKLSTLSTSEALDLLPPQSYLRRAVLHPVLAGILLDPDTRAPASFSASVQRNFIRGGAFIPSGGISEIPKQLSRDLRGKIHTNTAVKGVDSGGVVWENGRIDARIVVVATDAHTAAQLLPGILPSIVFRAAGYFHFLCEDSPLEYGAVYVPSLRSGPIYTVCNMSRVAPSYAKNPKELITVSFDPTLSRAKESTIKHLRDIFGDQAAKWELVGSGIIPNALPSRFGAQVMPSTGPVVSKGTVLAGDYLESPSVDGALASGRKAALAVLAQIHPGASPVPPSPR